jgi:hypothetical protein
MVKVYWSSLASKLNVIIIFAMKSLFLTEFVIFVLTFDSLGPVHATELDKALGFKKSLFSKSSVTYLF